MAAAARRSATIGPHGGEFVSPTRNVSCEIDWHRVGLPPRVDCQTLAPPRSVRLSASGAVAVCTGARCVGNPAENAEVLPYLTSLRVGPFLCASRLDGVACSARTSAFLIARAGITRYGVLPDTTTAVATDPAAHPVLHAVTGYGWLLAVDRAGQHAEIALACGTAGGHRLPAGRVWTIALSAVRSFALETDPANMAAGSVLAVSRQRWVREVRVNGWNGYLDLGGAHALVSDGPGEAPCAG